MVVGDARFEKEIRLKNQRNHEEAKADQMNGHRNLDLDPLRTQ